MSIGTPPSQSTGVDSPRPGAALIAQSVGLSVTFQRRLRLRRRAQVRALNDVSLDIANNEVVGLVGESGSGKSTLGRAFVGLVQPASGTVTFRGCTLPVRTRSERRAIGRHLSMVFQDPKSSVNPRLSVAAILLDPLRVHAVGDRRSRDARVRELLEAVGLPPSVLTRRVRHLSGGQVQRIAVARALALRPDLVVADEPTSALDLSVQAQLLNLLRDLRAKGGFSMLVISHDMRVMRVMADRLAVMYAGRIVEAGSVEQIHSAPRHPYTQALLAAVPKLRSLPDDDDRGLSAPEAAGRLPTTGCPFVPRCPKARDDCATAFPPRAGAPDHWHHCLHPD